MSMLQTLSVLMVRLLRQHSEPMAVLKGAWEDSTSLGMITALHEFIRHEHQGSSAQPAVAEGQRLIGAEDLEKLESLLLERITSEFEGDQLQSYPSFASIIAAWGRIDDKPEVKRRVAGRFQDEEFLGCFLESLLGQNHSHGLGDHVAVPAPHMDMDFVRSFVDPAELKERVAQMAPGAEGRRKVALETFLEQCDRPAGE